MQTIQSLLNRHEPLVLALMLELLHFSIWLDFGSPLSRSLMLSQLGLFLIWQPVWRHDEQISWFNSILFIILTLLFVTFMNWALLFAWLMLLIGFTGGRIILNRQQRAVYMAALIIIISELIIKCTPRTFGIPVPEFSEQWIGPVLSLIPLTLIILPYNSQQSTTHSIDLQHALGASTLVAVLISGSLLYTYIGHAQYLVALFQTLIVIALFLFTISWMMSPRTGFSGLSQLWSRALLNIGTPFEQWLTELSRVSQQQQTPEAFLEEAMEELVSLPWIEGAQWSCGDGRGEVGKLTKYNVSFNTDNLNVTISTYNPVGGALFLHCNLLVQVVDTFYVAKLHERRLTHQAHIQAIHETGARVTHDIKNLLQSMQAITSAINDTENVDVQALTRMLSRNLPHLTQRLQLALEKLQKPEEFPPDNRPLQDWWRDVNTRYARSNIRFVEDIGANPAIPADLFDSVIENLLENLREKMKLETGLTVTISLFSNPQRVRLLVMDNGSKVPEEKAEHILKEPVPSENGLGVGLYQVARQGDALGYTLALKTNVNGKVCFELCNKPRDASPKLLATSH